MFYVGLLHVKCYNELVDYVLWPSRFVRREQTHECVLGCTYVPACTLVVCHKTVCACVLERAHLLMHARTFWVPTLTHTWFRWCVSTLNRQIFTHTCFTMRTVTHENEPKPCLPLCMHRLCICLCIRSCTSERPRARDREREREREERVREGRQRERERARGRLCVCISMRAWTHVIKMNGSHVAVNSTVLKLRLLWKSRAEAPGSGPWHNAPQRGRATPRRE